MQRKKHCVFKNIATILLLLAFVCQTFSRAVIVVNFYANRDYIAKNLCENRAKPKMNCCGKCQLSKRLKQEDRQDQQNPERKAEMKYEVVLRSSFAVLPAQIAVQISSERFYNRADQCPAGVHTTLFHPPCA